MEHLCQWLLWTERQCIPLDLVDLTGPYLHAKTTVYSPPFRVRATQIHVLHDELTNTIDSLAGNIITATNAVSRAVVYQLLRNLTHGATLVGTVDRPFQTDNQGYLQGRGTINISDTLYALLPVETYTHTHYFSDTTQLYLTSAEAITTGLAGHLVVQAGVQTLTVSAQNPLIVLDLDVSIEWDTRNDPQFLSQLDFDLQRTSEYLYDWSNGQVALGTLTLYDNRQHWNDAHIRIYATNEMRPHAVQGGIVSEVITDPVTSTLVYEPGQVHIGGGVESLWTA